MINNVRFGLVTNREVQKSLGDSLVQKVIPSLVRNGVGGFISDSRAPTKPRRVGQAME